jgi:hypothetical protein
VYADRQRLHRDSLLTNKRSLSRYAACAMMPSNVAQPVNCKMFRMLGAYEPRSPRTGRKSTMVGMPVSLPMVVIRPSKQLPIKALTRMPTSA